MATKISYQDKNGKPASMIVNGSREMAEKIAKSLKNPTFSEVDADAPKVEVKVCPPGTAEAQREATNAFYAPVKAARRGTLVREDESVEHQAERMMEHFGAARDAGQPLEDAWRDWDFVNGRGS